MCPLTDLWVIWRQLYNPASAHNKGTLYLLWNVMKRTAVTTDVSKNVHAAEDLLQIVTDSHVIAAAATVQKIPSASSVTLPDEGIPHLARTCLDRFLRPIFFRRDNLSEDGVHTYACKMMLLGLLWYAFKDSIHDGDGSAVMSFWKALTVIFQLTGHRK